MVPRPASPTSLLWACQLKREHGHLLERMKGLEESQKACEAKVKTAEAITDSMKGKLSEIKEMATRISSIEEDDKDVKDWMKKLDEERDSRVRENGEKVRQLQQKITALEAECQKVQAEAEQCSSDYLAATKKIGKLEDTIQRQGKATDKLSKKNDPADIKVLMRRLDAMEARRNDDSRRHKELLDKIAYLETANKKLSEKTESFQVEIARLKGKTKSCEVEAVPSSEATTEGSYRDLQSPHILVPRSPLVYRVSQERVEKAFEFDDSPTLGAQLRKSAKIAPQESHGTQQAQRVPKEWLQSFDPNVPATAQNLGRRSLPGAANSRKKRGAAPTQDPRQTRSQAKIAMEKTKASQSTAPKGRMTQSKISKPKHEALKPTTANQQQTRKRRQISQVFDMDSFVNLAKRNDI